MPSERERFDLLLAALDDLAEANVSIPVVVEGKRDVAALAALGCGGTLVALNQGATLHDVCERLAAGARIVIVLTDWDGRGARLAADVTRLLAANGARAETTLRDRIRGNVDGVRHVESLLPYVASRVEQYYGQTVDERRAGLPVRAHPTLFDPAGPGPATWRGRARRDQDRR